MQTVDSSKASVSSSQSDGYLRALKVMNRQLHDKELLQVDSMNDAVQEGIYTMDATRTWCDQRIQIMQTDYVKWLNEQIKHITKRVTEIRTGHDTVMRSLKQMHQNRMKYLKDQEAAFQNDLQKIRQTPCMSQTLVLLRRKMLSEGFVRRLSSLNNQ